MVLLTTVLLIAACGKQVEQPIETSTAPITEITSSVCGDGTCDNDEMCVIAKLEASCPADCGPCPSSIYVEPLECGDSNCEKTGNNEFTVKIPSYIKSNVANLGETIANTMDTDFKCYENDNKVVQHARLKNFKGVVFDDYFDLRDKPTEVRLTARTTSGSKAIYRLDLKTWEQGTLEDFDITCNFEFNTHSPIKNDRQTWIIKYQK